MALGQGIRTPFTPLSALSRRLGTEGGGTMKKAAQERLQCRATLVNTGILLFRDRHTVKELFSRTSQSQRLNQELQNEAPPLVTTTKTNRSELKASCMALSKDSIVL